MKIDLGLVLVFVGVFVVDALLIAIGIIERIGGGRGGEGSVPGQELRRPPAGLEGRRR
jgi:hypothetical protein